jgi:hypothetical protein
MTVDAPWYVSNATLHADLGISSVQDVIQQRSDKHHNKIKTHETPILKTLLASDDNRRLKRNWPIDLISSTEVSSLDDTSSCHLKFMTLAYRMYILVAE